MCAILLFYIFSIQYFMVVAYDDPIEHGKTDKNSPESVTLKPRDLDELAENYDHINKEHIKSIKTSQLESNLHPSKFSTASEASNIQPESKGPCLCFSSRQLDTGASILSILGETVGIARAVFTTWFPNLPSIGTIATLTSLGMGAFNSVFTVSQLLGSNPLIPIPNPLDEVAGLSERLTSLENLELERLYTEWVRSNGYVGDFNSRIDYEPLKTFDYKHISKKLDSGNWLRTWLQKRVKKKTLAVDD